MLSMRSLVRSMGLRLAVLFLAAAAVWTMGAFAAEPAAPAIAFGPYVYDLTPTSAIIRWATVKAGEKTADGGSVYEIHDKKLTGLEPGTVCSYDALGTGSAEGKGAFTTFPQGPTPFHFAAYGDTRTRHDVHQKIVDRVLKEKPLLVINTGDLVSDGTKASDWEPFFRINKELMRNTPYIAVLGNHEKNAKMFFDVFRQSEQERYNSFVVGDVLFLMLDSEAPADAAQPDARKAYMTQQKEWVEKTLNEHKSIGFVLASFHKPLYCAKASRVAETKERREFWGDLFERHGVQIVLCGHDHYYLHAAHGGSHYLTSGGGGAPLYDIDTTEPEFVKAVKIEHFITVDVGLDKAALKVIDVNGQEIEHFDVAKRTKG